MTWSSAPRASWPSTSSPRPSPTACGWTSCAATRSTARAPSCASSCEDRDQAYVLRVPSSFRLTLASGITLTCKQAAARLGRRPRLGGPLGRDRIQRRALVRLGLAGHRLGPASPADPPPPDHRRAGLSLLLPARRPAGVPVPAGPRRRAALAGRRRFRVRQGLLRARPVPGPPLHRHRPAHRAGHGRPGHLRRHRRPAPPPHRHPGTRPGPPRPAPARRVRDDPAHRPRDRPPARPARPHPAAPRTGWTGAAATKPGHAGTTSEHGSPAIPQLSWSASEWLLPY